jgi:hypothetical protein
MLFTKQGNFRGLTAHREGEMKATHVLDCTGMILPSWWPKDGPKVIPLVKGKHGLDWDVVEGDLPADFVASLRKAIPSRDRAYTHYIDEAYFKPMGFLERALPKGTAIREI